MNHKRLYRLYREERLMVRRRGRRKRALGTRAPILLPHAINQRWSLDFVSDTLSDRRRFRILCWWTTSAASAWRPWSIPRWEECGWCASWNGWRPNARCPRVVSDNELSKKAMARNEHTSAVARRASDAGYDCAIVEKTMHRPGSLRVGAPSRVRSHSSPADAALDRRRHCG